MKVHASPERNIVAKATRRLLPLLVLMYFFSFLNRVNLSFAAKTMNEDLSFAPLVYGLGSGIFFIGYVLLEVPSNLALERFGARRWIARIMFTWGIISASMAFVSTPSAFYVLRFLLGAAEAGFFPGIILYLTYWYPARERAKIIGWLMAAIPVSTVIGAPLSGLILQLDDALGLHGWQWLFLLEGIPTVVLAFVALRYLPDGPAKASWLTLEERQWFISRHAVETETLRNHQQGTLAQVLRSPRVLLLGGLYFSILVGMYGLGFWIPQIITSFGVQTNLVGLVTAVPYVFGAVVMVLWAKHSDFTGERRWHVALPNFVAAGGFIIAALTNSPLLAIAAFTLVAIGIYSSLPTFWTLPTSFLTGTGAAAGIALINSMGSAGGFFGPYLMGYVKEVTQTFTGAFLVLAAFMALAGIAALTLGRLAPTRASETEQVAPNIPNTDKVGRP